jgi:KUP system potassium uptake protein
MLIRYTSLKRIGQIYIPFVNAVLFILVIILVLVFRSSSNLINAYGIAVSGTLLADTLLFLVVARSLYKKPDWYLFLVCLGLLPLDLLFVCSNAPKIAHGGLFPVIIGFVVCVAMYTWIKGDSIVENRRKAIGQNLQAFVASIHDAKPPLKRIPGAAIYIGHHTKLAPLALIATIEDFHELPEKVVIVTIKITTKAHVPREDRAVLNALKYLDGISHITLSYGYHDAINMPEDIKPLVGSTPELDFDLSRASYFISQAKVVAGKRHNLAPWRKTLFRFMYINALSETDYYQLPVQRTEEMQTLITL